MQFHPVCSAISTTDINMLDPARKVQLRWLYGRNHDPERHPKDRIPHQGLYIINLMSPGKIISKNSN